MQGGELGSSETGDTCDQPGARSLLQVGYCGLVAVHTGCPRGNKESAQPHRKASSIPGFTFLGSHVTAGISALTADLRMGTITEPVQSVSSLLQECCSLPYGEEWPRLRIEELQKDISDGTKRKRRPVRVRRSDNCFVCEELVIKRRQCLKHFCRTRPASDGFILSDFSVAKDDDTLCELHHIGFMRHHHNGESTVVQILEDVHDLDCRAAVEISGRFIGKQD